MNQTPVLVAVGLVRHAAGPDEAARWIVTRRPQHVHLSGSWELPGGKVAPGEAPVSALRRELREELGVEIADPTPLTFSWYRYPERTVLLLFFETETLAGALPRPLAATELRLVTSEELRALPLPPANEPLLACLEAPCDVPCP